MAPFSKIIHIDADCFFAAIEERDTPSLRGYPVAVGGDPNRRGVIATCNYDARRYGVRSAMPSSQAKRLCPNLIIVKPDMARYRIISSQMREIFSEYTSSIEPLSLDEAFLDVSQSKHCYGSATLMAKEIQERVYKSLGITVSAGVAQAKFLSKIASDWNKPHGLFVVAPGEEKTFLENLSVSKLPGVGPVMRDKLARLGITQCKDVLAWGQKNAVLNLGRFGNRLFQMCLGRDDSSVKALEPRKCVSVETTFEEDLASPADIADKIPQLLARLEERAPGNTCFVGQFVKMKFNDFKLRTMETRIEASGKRLCLENYKRLLFAMWYQERRPVRLLGLGLRIAASRSHKGQLPLPFSVS